jgi:hypothetical protein
MEERLRFDFVSADFEAAAVAAVEGLGMAVPNKMAVGVAEVGFERTRMEMASVVKLFESCSIHREIGEPVYIPWHRRADIQ